MPRFSLWQKALACTKTEEADEAGRGQDRPVSPNTSGSKRRVPRATAIWDSLTSKLSEESDISMVDLCGVVDSIKNDLDAKQDTKPMNARRFKSTSFTAAMQLSPHNKLNWIIYQLEKLGTKRENSFDKNDRLFRHKLSWMKDTGDSADADVQQYLQQTFTGHPGALSSAFTQYRAAAIAEEEEEEQYNEKDEAEIEAMAEHPRHQSLPVTPKTSLNSSGRGDENDDDGNDAAVAFPTATTVDASTSPFKPFTGDGGDSSGSMSRFRRTSPVARAKPTKQPSPLQASAPASARPDGSGDGAIKTMPPDRTGASVSNAPTSSAMKHWGSLATITAQKAAKVDELVLSCGAEKLLGGIESWSLNLFTLDAVSSGRPLVAIGLRAIENLGLYERLPINPLLCAKFFAAVEDGYGRYPDIMYHNNLHGADVLHTTYALLQNPALAGVFSDLEVFAALLAAAAHDMGHPGVNNTFLNSTSHEYALVYNDISTLENYHASTVFKLMARDGFNVLEGFAKPDAAVIRKLMVDMILGTDMVKHLDHLQQFRECMEQRLEHVEDASVETQMKVAEDAGIAFDLDEHDGVHHGPPPPMSDKNRVVVLNSIVHLADLSGPTKPWARSKVWAARVLKEFFNQGEKELELGIPVEPLNDGTKMNVAKGQKGFIGYVVAPLWEIWEDMVLAGKHADEKCEPIEMMHANLNKWQELIDEGDVSGNDFVAQTLTDDDARRKEAGDIQHLARRISARGNDLEESADQEALLAQTPTESRRARRRSSMRMQHMDRNLQTHNELASVEDTGDIAGGGARSDEQDEQDGANVAPRRRAQSMAENAAEAVAEMAKEAEAEAAAALKANAKANGKGPAPPVAIRRRGSAKVRSLPTAPGPAPTTPTRRGSRQLPVIGLAASAGLQDGTEA